MTGIKGKPPKFSIINSMEYIHISPVHLWLFCFFISAIYLLICTKSSPLYPFNDWVDANSFFTVGKGMMNGRIPYRDLFEQKGVLLFFLHGIAYLISNKTFLGVFFLEVLSFSVFIYFCYKILSLFIDQKYSLIALPFIAASVLNLQSFSYGDSAEEFCLPIIAIGLFCLIKYFKCIFPLPIPFRWILLNGILAGCTLWIKFTILGFWIGWMGSIFFFLTLEKNYRRAIYSLLLFLLGILLSSLPWIFYFGLNHSIQNWLDTYFISNIKYYATSKPINSIIKSMFYQIQKHFHLNPLFCGLLLLGTTFFAATKRFFTNPYHRFGILTCGLLLVISVYGGGTSYPYYFLIFSPFIVLGYVTLFGLIFEEFGKISSARFFFIIIAISIFTTSLYCLKFNQNVYFLKTDQKDLVQYQFSSKINQSETSTLLNYGALDLGFYTTTGITPINRFYCISNSRYPGQIEEQNDLIKNKSVEFVVTRLPISDSINRLEEIPYLYANYRLIDMKKQGNGGSEFNYFLFERNK